jgi:hypothetical protein
MKLCDHFFDYHNKNSQNKVNELYEEFRILNEDKITAKKNMDILNKNLLEIKNIKKNIELTKEKFSDSKNIEYRLKKGSILY